MRTNDGKPRWIFRVMPEIDDLKADRLIAMLPDLKKRGFDAVHITAPCESAGAWPWWGLRPRDYFRINRSFGDSMEDWERFVAETHALGMDVIIFLNLGYDDISSGTWQQACRERRARRRQSYLTGRSGRSAECGKEGTDRKEAAGTEDFYVWKDARCRLNTGDPYFRQEGKWVLSPEAEDEYFCHWDMNEYNCGYGPEPQYNWGSESFRQYARKILRFWLDTGVDGVILDAVNFYVNCTAEIMKNLLSELRADYPGTFYIPEGAGGFGDDLRFWTQPGMFTIAEDQPLDSDLAWNGSRILTALTTGDDRLLRERLRWEEDYKRRGIIFWSYPGWGDAWTPELRRKELQILRDAGHWIDWIPSYGLPWPDEL